MDQYNVKYVVNIVSKIHLRKNATMAGGIGPTYGHESWTLRKAEEDHIRVSEMKELRQYLKGLLDKKKLRSCSLTGLSSN